ncbi:MAG: C40 family peptidase [Peptoanaerobacter stomatis]|uniref:C40 family peptidase n=1 Tax=Peptoanaerobacter stomatis TaxID=796937 RepID=UPI003FA0C205
MIIKKTLLAAIFTLGFAGLSMNFSYADEAEIFNNEVETKTTVAKEVAEPVNIEVSELEKLLALNEEQTKIEEKVEKERQAEKVEEEISVSADADKLIVIAKSKLGSPYSFGSLGPSAFDCSGYTSYVFRQMGISLPRTASSQAYGGVKVTKANLKKGDLVFFNTYGGISHVGIYIENGNFIHASSYGSGVVVSNINDSYYAPRYVTAARYL